MNSNRGRTDRRMRIGQDSRMHRDVKIRSRPVDAPQHRRAVYNDHAVDVPMTTYSPELTNGRAATAC
jgi:hypothetical protein